MAVRLLKNPKCLKHLRYIISNQIRNRKGIFNTELNTYYFLHGMEAVADINFLCKHNKNICSKHPNSKRLISVAPLHIVVTTSNFILDSDEFNHLK